MDITTTTEADLYIDEVVTNSDGTARDLTGAAGTLHLYDAPGGAELAQESAMVTDAEGGLLSYFLTTTDLEPYSDGFHVLYFELMLHEAGGVDSRLDFGKLSLN